MDETLSRYRGHRFPPLNISHAVWLYHRFSLSFRDVEDLLAERGIIVSFETIRQWCRKFGSEYAWIFTNISSRYQKSPRRPAFFFCS